MPQASQESPGCAIALVVIGLLILIPSGLCTTVVASDASMNAVSLALFIGGPFILFGAALLAFGVWRLKKMNRGSSDSSEPPASTG